MKHPYRDLIFAVAVLWVLIVGFHLLSALAGYPQYRDQHLGAALEYAKGSIDLLRPVIPGFNMNGSPTPQELPLWQAFAAILMKAFGSWWGWGNVASLLLFATGLWPLYQIAEAWLGKRGAWWTLFLYLAQPIVFFAAGWASTDGLSATLAVWFVYFAERMVRTGSWGLALGAAVAGTLTAVTKLPFFFAVGLVAFCLTVDQNRRNLKRWVQLALVGLVSAVLFLLWTHYTEQCFSRGVYPVEDLHLSHMWRWYFGDMRFRSNPMNWIKGGWRALMGLFGSFVLAALGAWSFFSKRPKIGCFWLGAAAVTTLVFAHLVLAHRNYYLFYSPAVAFLMAGAFVRIEDQFRSPGKEIPAWVSLTACGFVLLGTAQGLLGMEVVLGYDPYPKKIAALIREHTSPGDKLLIWNGGWGGDMFLLSGRAGLTLHNNMGVLRDSKALAVLKSAGYNKLVLISDSPLLWAVQVANPSQTHLQRLVYREAAIGVDFSWPHLFENDDLVIEAIP